MPKMPSCAWKPLLCFLVGQAAKNKIRHYFGLGGSLNGWFDFIGRWSWGSLLKIGCLEAVGSQSLNVRFNIHRKSQEDCRMHQNAIRSIRFGHFLQQGVICFENGGNTSSAHHICHIKHHKTAHHQLSIACFGCFQELPALTCPWRPPTFTTVLAKFTRTGGLFVVFSSAFGETSKGNDAKIWRRRWFKKGNTRNTMEH